MGTPLCLSMHAIAALLHSSCRNCIPIPSARPSRYRRDAPDEIFRSDAGCLYGGTDKTASGQPYSPCSTDDAQSQTEGDAEVGIAVRRHVGEDLAPPGVAVL